ncbi:alpha/beta hydrolase [Actinoplanes sp. GCM10030250]|uniref:alpha/beta hydrolase n=1 Tax=Actinoplanes sp. GCM10030250 TaxID=3273376 RepID=UPI003614C70B
MTPRVGTLHLVEGKRFTYSFAGLAGATVLFCLSLTPSLLPRGYLFQGLVSGVLAATGYALGTLSAWLAGQVSGHRLPHPSRTARRVLTGLAAVAVVVSLVLGARWQDGIHRLVGVDPPPLIGYALVLPIAVPAAAGLVALARLLLRGARRLGTLFGRWIPPAAARVIAGLAVLTLLVGVLNGVVIRAAFSAADASFSTLNGETSTDVAAPADPLRSGGPGSLVTWDSLGNQGRQFIGAGPDLGELRQFGGPGARPPVRVYIGLDAAESSRERAALAVGELRRTGAFERSVLCLITTTGTGWVNAQAADPLEYMYNGDTALVATQYSYLPSPISFLVDKERARAAGRDLFDQVYAVWSRMPRADRPKLLVFGESLGSFGTEAMFSGVEDIRNRTDGMLLVGPPFRNPLWGELVAERDAGSREVLPVYERGATVRFAADPAGLGTPGTVWGSPRIVYLQYPSDPITWWSPRLMVSRPDWLEEPRGADVSPSFRWFPFVTFWQVSADMAVSNSVPDGHGHNFGTAPTFAWAQIAPPPGWTSARTAALAELLADEG